MPVKDISVVIPTYNCGRFLGEAIASVLDQTHPVDEILVVDDGSSDNTRDVAAGFGDRVRYLYQENRGPAAARNHGIREAKSEWIAILDADDFWKPEKIDLQVREVARDPKAVLIYTSFCQFFPDGTERIITATDPNRLWPRLRYENCVSGGSNVLVRRDVLVAENGFDETVRGVEDWDCWARLAKRYRFAAVSTPVTMVRIRPESLSYNHFKLAGETRKILDKTLVSDLHGLRRAVWRRRIWSSVLFHCAVSAQGHDSNEERKFLMESLLEWPSPTFLPKRWAALSRSLLGAKNWANLRRLSHRHR